MLTKMVSGLVPDNNIREVYIMKKLKNFVYGLICATAATITTYKILTLYFFYVSQTNDTTAPLAAFITSIPLGFYLFHISVRFYKYLIKIARTTIKAMV